LRTSFGLSFNLKKNRLDGNGKSVIYMRITVDSESCDISTKGNVKRKNGIKFLAGRRVKRRVPMNSIPTWILCNIKCLK